MTGSFAQFDHFILLVPYSYLDNPPPWIADNFVLSPGGRHADNKTENRLILFRDGTYLEIIAFVDDDPEKRRGHWWDKPFGVIDFALGTVEPLDHEALNKRLQDSGSGISYGKPNDGGRTTDGKDIKWRVTFPEGVERGAVPFWCEDVTNRDWRVPVTEKNTAHPCGALGVAAMALEVKKKNLDRLSSATSAILDLKENSSNRYDVKVPKETSNLKAPSIRLQEASQDSLRDLALTLVLQTGKPSPRGPIREPIEDGVVLIEFE